jgi:hypothetical protein
MCRDLLWNGVGVTIMWISSHVGFEGNELVDERARHAALNGAVFDRPLSPVNFQDTADTADTGIFTHSILPKDSLRPWFGEQKEDRKFVSPVSKIKSGVLKRL